MAHGMRVWWRSGLVQAVHVQAAPGRTVCGIEIPDDARTAPGREVVCAGCLAGRPIATSPASGERVAEVEALLMAVEAERVALGKRVAVLEGELKTARRLGTVAGRREVQAREDATAAGQRAIVAEAEVARLAERVASLERRLAVEEMARRSVEGRLADAQGETRRALDALKVQSRVMRAPKARKGAA